MAGVVRKFHSKNWLAYLPQFLLPFIATSLLLFGLNILSFSQRFFDLLICSSRIFMLPLEIAQCMKIF